MDSLEQIGQVLKADDIEFERHDRQLVFAAVCGVFRARFRIFQNGFLLVLIAETGFCPPAGRRSAVAEFCTAANYALLAFTNLEMDRGGEVILRHSLMLPADGSLADDQLRWFVWSAFRVIEDLAPALVEVATTSADPYAVVTATSDLLYPERKDRQRRIIRPTICEAGEA